MLQSRSGNLDLKQKLLYYKPLGLSIVFAFFLLFFKKPAPFQSVLEIEDFVLPFDQRADDHAVDHRAEHRTPLHADKYAEAEEDE